MHRTNGLRQCGRIVGSDQQRFLRREHVGDASDGAGDDRRARRHRLEQHDRRALRAGAEREHVESRKQPPRRGDVAQPAHPIAQSQARGRRLELWPPAPVAHDRHDHRQVREQGQGREQHIRPLFRGKPSHPADVESPVGDRELLACLVPGKRRQVVRRPGVGNGVQAPRGHARPLKVPGQRA
ncbi:MAG: hypothetical protein DMD44_11145 [Gemmatimonadetes bacterium]|nr:MAG: hypothetical protein DMD44_11145 [Gemmatimonadota bacterium]